MVPVRRLKRHLVISDKSTNFLDVRYSLRLDYEHYTRYEEYLAFFTYQRKQSEFFVEYKRLKPIKEQVAIKM